MEKNVITKAGLKELKIELENLIKIERPKVILEIKEARAQGDLSENAEFDAARQKQGQIEDRIRDIENIIENSKVTNVYSKTNKVKIGSKVTVQNLKDMETETYTIVGTLESNPFKNFISNISPMGSALIEKSENDETSFVVLNKNNKIHVDLKILKIQ